MNSNTSEQHQSYSAAQSADEIDLFELFQSIWQEKILIVIITTVITALALVYALTATPIYQAQASLVPPPAYAIQGYNEGRMQAFQGGEFKEYNVESIYKIYRGNLGSL